MLLILTCSCMNVICSRVYREGNIIRRPTQPCKPPILELVESSQWWSPKQRRFCRVVWVGIRMTWSFKWTQDFLVIPWLSKTFGMLHAWVSGDLCGLVLGDICRDGCRPGRIHSLITPNREGRVVKILQPLKSKGLQDQYLFISGYDPMKGRTSFGFCLQQIQLFVAILLRGRYEDSTMLQCIILIRILIMF